MIFSDLTFIIIFCAFLPAYHAISHQTARLAFLLCASLVFYGWWDIRFIPVLALLSLVGYASGIILSKSNLEWKWRKQFIYLAIITLLIPLIYFKYYIFIVNTAITALQINIDYKHNTIILPLGISFFTFQAISYVTDVNNGSTRAEPSFFRFLVYMFFFPHIVAGPIVRARDFLHQLQPEWNSVVDADTVIRNVTRFLWGAFKKVYIGDRLAITIIDPAFAHIDTISTGTLLVATFAFGIQIYADFSGYSDMAISLARLMGFQLRENFASPYTAISVRDFWRRWHISLSTLIRDLIYIPLGGNRTGSLRSGANLVIAMTLCGLWHGANLAFVLWGACHGLALLASRMWRSCKLPQPHWLISWGATHLTVMSLWYLFRAGTVELAISGLRRISLDSFKPQELSPHFLVLILVTWCIIMTEQIALSYARQRNVTLSLPMVTAASVALIIVMTVFGDPNFGARHFIYFNF